MLLDTRIIARHQQHAVLAECQQVLWQDASYVMLHRVYLRGVEQTFLRALQYHGEQWLVFDLRSAEPSFRADLLALPRADAAGVVLHTLRLSFTTADEFVAKVYKQPIALWLAESTWPQRFEIAPGPYGPRVVLQPELRAAA